MLKIKYQTTKYNFSEIISNILNTENLTKIHKENHFEKYNLFTRDKDQSTKYHRIYYDNFVTKVQNTYLEVLL